MGERFAERASRVVATVSFARYRYPIALSVRPHESDPLAAWLVARISVIDRDRGLPLGIVVDTILDAGEPGDDEPPQVLESVRRFLHAIAMHEIDECTFVNGRRHWDPHSDEARGEHREEPGDG